MLCVSNADGGAPLTHRCRVFFGKLSNQLCVVGGESAVSSRRIKAWSSLYRLFPVVVKDDFSEQTRCSIVHVDDDMFKARDGLKGTLDEIRSGRSQNLRGQRPVTRTTTHLDPDVVGHFIPVNQFTDKVEVWLGSRWICNFDLFESNLNQMSEKSHLLLIRHG